MSRRGFAALVPALAACLVAGCARSTASAAKTVDGVAYGVTKVPFSNRWWHFYERGVSWEGGGFWREAEADLRQAVALRQADSRRARTYGMHFVQCFAHRELGAALARLGRFDEAEAEIRISMAQEPSAKAEFLLASIERRRRGQAPEAPVLAAADAPVDAGQAIVETAVAVDSVAPGADGRLAIGGQLLGTMGAMLFAVADGQAPRPIVVAADGSFSAEIEAGGKLAVARPGADGAPAALTVLTAPAPAAAPELALRGPEDGAVVTGDRVIFRFDAKAGGELTAIDVDDGGAALCHRVLHGVQEGGMLSWPLAPGAHHLRFRLATADGGEVMVERAIEARPAPRQDRSLRATALIAPPAAPETSLPLRPLDGEWLLTALQHNARFRVVDRDARAILGKELAMAEAGLIPRAAAAKAGRLLQARYVVAGTLSRTTHDIECYLRLISAESGRVVATADAYAQTGSGFAEQAFYDAVAERLRQVFPVLEAGARPSGERLAIDVGARHGVAVDMLFHVLPADQDGPQQPVARAEVVQVAADRSEARWLTPSVSGKPVRAVSE